MSTTDFATKDGSGTMTTVTGGVFFHRTDGTLVAKVVRDSDGRWVTYERNDLTHNMDRTARTRTRSQAVRWLGEMAR